MHCSSWHFSFLCVNLDTGDDKKNADMTSGCTSSKKNNSSNKPVSVKPKEKSLSNGNNNNSGVITGNLSILSAISGSVNIESILPMFTCRINDHSANIRSLKDSGSQFNFISEKVARELH